MILELWWVGKTSTRYLEPGITEYTKRIKHFNRFEIREFVAAKVKRTEDQAIVDDQNFLKNIEERDHVIILDETGVRMNSRGFSKYLDQILSLSSRKIIFIIGGSYGIGDALKSRANDVLSLSEFTFTHDMVRLIFLEQLYRAFTIRNNLPYHH